MLFSMTGYGDASRQHEKFSLAVEVRSVNNRYFKLALKSPDLFSGFESQIEKLVRRFTARGTVSVALRIRRAGREGQFSLNQELLEQYWKQLHQLAETIHVATPIDLGSLLQLPGAIQEAEQPTSATESDWLFVEETLTEALTKLQTFRETEGASMQADLVVQCAAIRQNLEKIEQFVPDVVAGHRDRLLERVRELIANTDVDIQPQDLIREVSIFADRSDINEEITRLQSHLEQFDTFLTEDQSQGRKLEFLGQEMNREINTIGSKANHVSIAHCVVDMKSAVEKMREILQNVE